MVAAVVVDRAVGEVRHNGGDGEWWRAGDENGDVMKCCAGGAKVVKAVGIVHFSLE